MFIFLKDRHSFFFENVIGLKFIDRNFCFCQKLWFVLISTSLTEVLIINKNCVDFGLWLLSFCVCGLMVWQ